MTDTPSFDGLSEAEYAAFEESSKIKDGEDHSTWTARAAREAEALRTTAAERRAAAAAREAESAHAPGDVQ